MRRVTLALTRPTQPRKVEQALNHQAPSNNGINIDTKGFIMKPLVYNKR